MQGAQAPPKLKIITGAIHKRPVSSTIAIHAIEALAAGPHLVCLCHAQEKVGVASCAWAFKLFRMLSAQTAFPTESHPYYVQNNPVVCAVGGFGA